MKTCSDGFSKMFVRTLQYGLELSHQFGQHWMVSNGLVPLPSFGSLLLHLAHSVLAVQVHFWNLHLDTVASSNLTYLKNSKDRGSEVGPCHILFTMTVSNCLYPKRFFFILTGKGVDRQDMKRAAFTHKSEFQASPKHSQTLLMIWYDLHIFANGRASWIKVMTTRSSWNEPCRSCL